MNWRKVLIPSFAFLRSVQAGSDVPPPVWHMEPVRSRTSMMSRGFDEHGEHAVALAFTLSFEMPRMRAKSIPTSVDAFTFTALYAFVVGEQPGADWTQRMVMVVWTFDPVVISFGDPALGPYSSATWVASVGSGRCCAAARAAASTLAWSWRWTR